MKLRLKKGRQAGGRELVVTLQRGESLNPHQAAWLRDGRHKNYLPFSYEYTHDVTDAVLRYDVGDAMSLDTFLKRHAERISLSRMLVGMAEALTWCARGGNNYFSMLFDARHVFVTGDSDLRFVFVPVDHVTFKVENSPLTLLQVLGDAKRIRYPSQADTVVAEHLADHVLNADNAFSFNSFRAFLVENCGVDVTPDGMVSRVDNQGACEAVPFARLVMLPHRSPRRRLPCHGPLPPRRRWILPTCCSTSRIMCWRVRPTPLQTSHPQRHPR